MSGTYIFIASHIPVLPCIGTRFSICKFAYHKLLGSNDKENTLMFHALPQRVEA
jgi:hypothetical protein